MLLKNRKLFNFVQFIQIRIWELSLFFALQVKLVYLAVFICTPLFNMVLFAFILAFLLKLRYTETI